jgi:hypothetical protein
MASSQGLAVFVYKLKREGRTAHAANQSKAGHDSRELPHYMVEERMANALENDFGGLDDLLQVGHDSNFADFLARFARIKDILKSRESSNRIFFGTAIERLENSQKSTEPDMLIGILDGQIEFDGQMKGSVIQKTAEMIDSARKNNVPRSDILKLVKYRSDILELYSNLSVSCDAIRWELMVLRAKLDPSKPVGPTFGEPFDSDAYADSLK